MSCHHVCSGRARPATKKNGAHRTTYFWSGEGAVTFWGTTKIGGEGRVVGGGCLTRRGYKRRGKGKQGLGNLGGNNAASLPFFSFILILLCLSRFSWLMPTWPVVERHGAGSSSEIAGYLYTCHERYHQKLLKCDPEDCLRNKIDSFLRPTGSFVEAAAPGNVVYVHR